MSGLIFPFKELIDECETIKAHAHEFLDKKSAREALDVAKSTLDGIKNASPRPSVTRWQIPLDAPLRTLWSDGHSQPDGNSRYRVRAEISFVWEIRKLDEAKWRNNKYFLLDGLASTVTTLVAAENDRTDRIIARWTTDVADANSPGVHFHFQVNRPDSDEFPFPKSLDVPRLPAPLMSPFLVIDLALGELFQDRWKRHSLVESKHGNRWRKLHQNRTVRFLQWQTKCVQEFGGSPWMALKLAKPPRGLLVEET